MKVRVELGPRDAHKNQACLAISTTPGEVAKKTSYQVCAFLRSTQCSDALSSYVCLHRYAIQLSF